MSTYTDRVYGLSSKDPETRIRVNHSRTAKDGWRHETTVEVTGTNHDDLLSRMREMLVLVDDEARIESARRNRVDAGVEL